MQIAYLGTDDALEAVHARHGPGSAWVRCDRLEARWTSIGAVLADRPIVEERLAEAVEAGCATGEGSGGTVTRCVDAAALVVACGLNFRDHADEVGASLPEEPFLFPKLTRAVASPVSTLVVPRGVVRQLDYEVELAVYVGAVLRDAGVAEAAAAIGGFAVANDLSAREHQAGPWSNWVRAKGLDGFLPLGPWVTTADVADLRPSTVLGSTVNGSPRQLARMEDMIFPPAELLSHVSQGLTLQPGDVVLSGTPAGVAHGRPDRPYLEAGDQVTCHIDGLGEVTTFVEG